MAATSGEACVRTGSMTAAAAAVLMAAAFGLTASAQGQKGYLTPEQLPLAAGFLPPPPAEGSPRAVADRQTYVETRALKDQPRWTLAQDEDNIAPNGAARLFDCTLGARLASP